MEAKFASQSQKLPQVALSGAVGVEVAVVVMRGLAGLQAEVVPLRGLMGMQAEEVTRREPTRMETAVASQ